MKILAVFYYPLLYYPLLVCCTLQHRAGYAFGSLLALSHFGVQFWQKVDCPETTEVGSVWRSIHKEYGPLWTAILERSTAPL